MREAASDQNHSHASSGNIAGSAEWLMTASFAGRWKRLAGRESWARRKVLLAVVPSCSYSRPGRTAAFSCHCVPKLDPLRTARRRTEMAIARLRLFPYPEDENEDANTPSIPIQLSDLYPLLAQAYRDKPERAEGIDQKVESGWRGYLRLRFRPRGRGIDAIVRLPFRSSSVRF